MIDEDFRALLVTIMPTDMVLEKGKISQERATTRGYYQRSTENNDLDLNATPGLTTVVFDVEIASLDEDTTQTLAYQLANGNAALTTLNGAIDASVTSVIVTSLLNIPTSGLPFIITAGTEKMAITDVDTATKTLTVTRGYASTTAVSHLSGVSIYAIGLDGYMGVMGERAALGIFIEDQSDDYEPKLLDADEGYFVQSFQATVITP